ncbi:hypothetical protein TCAL_04076 [Tigriopus californicus]|uniref:DNA polymerase n=1 Tax=Tigriopus californicus TaxID=6832 RepID=A0A553PG51_TIGCA|nr:DNA polymerase alpha catalytic subunit-like [Tigriopus californicus]TRY76652.1 hypothetical protein TCAL_04076 [Tigriopus californicus]|eukprot:TCALIF_04076-PA protein Name:"Similar to POLA1 DNA polymerase alpha catalytic subunit (Homo sapiens)" AED:0.05 eAED:0.05 QI:109/1/1/1/1/1/7/43/1499
MSADEAPTAARSTTGSLAASRSRRGPSQQVSARHKALAQLKRAQAGDYHYEVPEELTDHVYDYVSEAEYGQRVQARQAEAFIVDDEDTGLYVEDGREIFDEEHSEDEADQAPGRRRGTWLSTPGAKQKKKAAASGSGPDRGATRGHIKNMLLAMPGKKSTPLDSQKSVAEDELLASLLDQVKPKSGGSSGGMKKKKPWGHPKVTSNKESVGTAALSSPINPFARPRSTGIRKPKTPLATRNPECHEDLSALDTLARDSDTTASQFIEDDFPDDDGNDHHLPNHPDEEDLANLLEEDGDEFQAEPMDESVTDLTPDTNRGFQETAKTKSKADLSNWTMPEDQFRGHQQTQSAPEWKLESGDLPLVSNKHGEKVLRMYWLDAFEDPFKQPGKIWLFGKVFIQRAGTHVSCCLQVNRIMRRIFLLKRASKYDMKAKCDTGIEVAIGDVYNEFDQKVAARYKIAEHRSKMSEMNYAFELADVPDRGEYLEVQYDPQYPALPSNLQGETFSRIFGANQSSLEHFLISRKFKGPSWIEIKMPQATKAPMSWCKVEALCENSDHVSVLYDKPPPMPPLTVLSLNMKTTINAKTKLNEIALVSGLVHDEVYLDRPAPKEPFKYHFCALTRPSDQIWPFDFQRAQGQANAIKLEKMDSERALLAFLLAKMVKIDPDIILGHDITGFDLDVLLHRTVINKVPNWSRLGRLKRIQAPMFKGKLAERMAVTGRLVCDLKISAKELIRSKSYELGVLVDKLLGKDVEDRIEVTCEDMAKAYENSKALLHAAQLSSEDALDTLKCVYELNALPLALQITQVAGNVMSRTLLGGRAERNEYLLLHAFSDRGFIFPDKTYGKKKIGKDDDQDEGETLGSGEIGKPGRKKPSYTGGLVLEPKKGFYDHFILLMDFNSLYPSIIQEYNICFTTVNRRQVKAELNEDGESKHQVEEFVPDLPPSTSTPGVLPTEIKKLVDSRRSVKQLLKNPELSPEQRMQYDIRQMALKLTANSMYGCLGFSHSRFYAKPLAALVTSRGREILMQTKHLVERMNLEVIYGDTDSIMINTNSIDYDEVFKLGFKIKQEVNKMYKLLELDVDGVYRYMLLLKKKKYAAVTMERKPDGHLVTNTELKGLDIVRRDWSKLAADAGKVILDRILSDVSADDRVAYIHEKLEILANDLREGRIPLSSLAITKQLTKNPNEYAEKKAQPHVQVAIRLNSKGGKKLKAGDTVEYVICDDGSNLPATQRAYHVEEVKDRPDLKVDINYYLAQQLHPVVCRLCDPLDGTDASRIAQSLGLNPDEYRRSNVRDRTEDTNVELNQDKYRQCQKLEIACPHCHEKVVVDGPDRLSDRIWIPFLLECPMPKCRQPLFNQIGKIQNKITLMARQHINKFTLGTITCEDPACSGRSRQLPLRFHNAYPLCPTCDKGGNMYKEYTDKELYVQFEYLLSLFDLSHSKVDMKAAPTMSKCFESYFILKNHVERIIQSNQYSLVNLKQIYQAFHSLKVAKLRNAKRV